MIEYKVETCQVHSQEAVIAIDESELDLKIRKLCLQCLAKGYKRKVTLIKDSINQVEETKAQIKQDRQCQLQNNLESLSSLVENIEQLKDFYIQKIETTIEFVKKWIIQIQNIEEEFINKMSSHDQNDLQQFLSFIKQQQDIQIKEQPQFQSKIQEILINMKEPDLLIKCKTILLNVHSISTVFEKNTIIEDETNDLIELKLQCEDHPQKRIILLDVGQEKTCRKRLACESCLDIHPSLHYKSITYVHSQWKQVLQKRQENMNKNLESMQQKVESIKNMLQQMQKSINQQFVESIQKLTSKFNQYGIQVDEVQRKINISWQKLSQEDISKIAEELSKIDQPSIFDDPLLHEYTTQDNQVNKIMQDILLSLQESQVTQLNQLNPFIKGQLLSKMEKQLQGTYTGLDQLGYTLKDIDTQTNIKNINLQLQNQEIQYSMQIQKAKNSNFKLEFQTQEIQSQNLLREKENLKQFTYDLIKESSIKQDQTCCAMAFNKDKSIVAVGCDQQIKIFEFKQGIMEQIQLLNKHENNISTLNFMKKTNQLISGSHKDGQIIIWLMNQKNQWTCSQILNGHSKGITCLIFNNNEDLIISGSFDKTIKFWVKQIEWISQQTITDHEKDVYALSLNEKQNRLISCSDDDYIFIIEFYEQDKLWIVKQRIKQINFGIRLCFINDNLFSCQLYQKDQLYIYELNNSNGQYIKTKEFQVRYSQKDGYCLFPQQYIKQKCLLINKNGQYINLMKKNQNDEFEMGQIIEYQTSRIYGSMSDDGEYLITWDEYSKEIQIRKYQEK
ncbi:unnamed protein product [Paramecium primaurelia]|uniref:Uncharacterized protein n=1 Tax=Paramecium primaurelia TaxID=5886 RepID=A0A8S1QU42_PARPR|nr:unnamed protein product [Paramecium primaurelia]